jgi:hypothetical protein
MTEREQEANAVLQQIAKDIKEKLPEKMGFALLAYEFGPTKEDQEHKMLYVSNSQREDVILAMTEFIKKQLDDPTLFGKDA